MTLREEINLLSESQDLKSKLVKNPIITLQEMMAALREFKKSSTVLNFNAEYACQRVYDALHDLYNEIS